MDADWLTIRQVADLLGIGIDNAYSLAAKGELPATGWPLRVHRSEVLAFIERCRIKPGTLGRGSNQYQGRPEQGVAGWYRHRGARHE